MVRMKASAPLIFDTICFSPSVFPTLVQGQFGRTDRRRQRYLGRHSWVLIEGKY
jgi:hypothetical protein